MFNVIIQFISTLNYMGVLSLPEYEQKQTLMSEIEINDIKK